jgi:drug/metabolite transporter (DMT)-like permease
LFGEKNPQTGWAIRYGILTGVIIAGYTVWDKQAVSRFMIPPVLLDWSFSLGRTLVLSPYAIRRWDEVKHQWKINKRPTIGVAVLNPLSYILVLTAMIFTPVSYVAPAREVSILFGTLMGAKILEEEDARRRILGASIMIAGVIALGLG